MPSTSLRPNDPIPNFHLLCSYINSSCSHRIKLFKKPGRQISPFTINLFLIFMPHYFLALNVKWPTKPILALNGTFPPFEANWQLSGIGRGLLGGYSENLGFPNSITRSHRLACKVRSHHNGTMLKLARTPFPILSFYFLLSDNSCFPSAYALSMSPSS